MREPSTAKTPSAKPHRYLGLELAGAKNQKTALAVLEFYPREKKIFVLDTYDRIAAKEDQTGDEALIEVIDEVGEGVALLGVNVPLQFPPCAPCTSAKGAALPAKSTVPAVKWMRDFTRKISKHPPKDIRVRDFTPYTQRPIELWIRYQVLSQLPVSSRFEIDETLGGTKAPLAARMNFLKWHLGKLELVEVWPKLSVALLAQSIGIHRRTIETYRNLEAGAGARQAILETMAERFGIFIYDRDMRKLSTSLAAFDAFICSYTALLSDIGRCAKVPAGFPAASGWIAFPDGGAR